MTATGDPAALVSEAERVAEDDPVRAQELARAALAADPRYAPAANVLGVMAFAAGRLVEAQMMFELACTLPAADDDMVENLALVRRRLGAIYVAAAAEPEPAPADPLGYDANSTQRGRAFATAAQPTTAVLLDQIPSATSAGERSLIHAFAQHVWNGQDDVFENGPLLGGTTRALALGMIANPNRDPASRLHTYDWFNATIPLDVPEESFEDLIAVGLLDPDAVDAMRASGSFKPVFDDLHGGHDYSEVVVSHTGALPGSPADLDTMPDLFVPEPGSTWRLLLVDGCKSWYGTRHFMKLVAGDIPAGSHMLFQDYGWYTCFWLSALVGFFADRFKLIAHIDTTYAFELIEAITPDEVERAFPVSPVDLGVDGIDTLYGDLIARSSVLGDAQLHVALSIHHAGAIAYVGDVERAAAMIDALGRHPIAAGHRSIIDRARRSPTYAPDGPIYL